MVVASEKSLASQVAVTVKQPPLSVGVPNVGVILFVLSPVDKVRLLAVHEVQLGSINAQLTSVTAFPSKVQAPALEQVSSLSIVSAPSGLGPGRFSWNCKSDK